MTAAPIARARLDERRALAEVAAGGRTDPPGRTTSCTTMAAGSGPVASRPRGPGWPAASRGVVASTGTTASAPSGSRAPVAIRTAVPGRTMTSGAPGPHLADHLEPEARPTRRRPTSVSAAWIA